MDADEVEAAKVALRKDALTARYAAVVAWWQAMTGAGLGATVLAAAGRLGGQWDAAASAVLARFGGLFVGLGIWGWLRQDGNFIREVAGLVEGLERLKSQVGP